LVFWHFGNPSADFWDRFNSSYEGRFSRFEPTQSDVAQDVSPAPAYRDLSKDPVLGPELAWKSQEHLFPINFSTQRKLRTILESVGLEIDILRDNIANLKNKSSSAGFTAKKVVFREGRVFKVELLSASPSVDLMVGFLKQDVLDYNSIVDALRSAGYYYLGLDKITIVDDPVLG
jgi:hypothetical protein